MFGFPQSLPPHSDPAMESEQAMLPEREYERPKPSNGVLRHPLEPDSSASCFQQLRGKGPELNWVVRTMGILEQGEGKDGQWGISEFYIIGHTNKSPMLSL